jgi:hypothetical protein
MSTAAIKKRPDTSEYPSHTEDYVALVPDGDIVATLSKQLGETLALISVIPEGQGTFRYAEDKWSIKEVLGHVIDGERVLAYRALRFARGDKTPLAGYEQDDFVRGASFDKRTIMDTRRLVNVAGLPSDIEIESGWNACVASMARPATQERIKELIGRGFCKPGDAENRLGDFVGQHGR